MNIMENKIQHYRARLIFVGFDREALGYNRFMMNKNMLTLSIKLFSSHIDT